MEETQHLSKYARKQQRLAEEKNFGTDYSKQIEQAEREQQESDAPKNTQKIDAMRKHQRLKDKAIATIERKKIEVQAFQMLLDSTPENDVNVRTMWAKKLCAAKQTIEQMTNARDMHLSKMRLIQQELKLNEQ
jgi:hypothetical protein